MAVQYIPLIAYIGLGLSGIVAFSRVVLGWALCD
jgi:hypothetical protein